MDEQQHLLDFCGRSLLQWPVEITPVDPIACYGCGGWNAIFKNAFTIL
jgi:hypothetical protein